MTIREEYITVHEAAEMLGVAMNTIRSWGAAGKIPEYRHPMNGYRLYKRRDLQQVIEKLERSVVATPSKPRRRPR